MGDIRFVDKTGERHGRLVIVGFAGMSSPKGKQRPYRLWLCQCDCGNSTKTRYGDLASGHTRSCGCLPRENTRDHPGRNRKSEGTSAFNQMYAGYKKSARQRGICFDLTPDDFRVITKMDCYYCGLPPSQLFPTVKGTYGDCLYTGIDRVDNTRGYIADNVSPCCKQCNYAKRNLAEQEFYEWIKRLVAYFKEI